MSKSSFRRLKRRWKLARAVRSEIDWDLNRVVMGAVSLARPYHKEVVVA
jgi:hypothetical protein